MTNDLSIVIDEQIDASGSPHDIKFLRGQLEVKNLSASNLRTGATLERVAMRYHRVSRKEIGVS